jgi:glycosyltransferase involved in cell wall biosynthesis
MRILHTVQLYHPKVGGSEEVVKQLSERLAARGHDVTVATAAEPTRSSKMINGVTIAEFQIHGNEVEGLHGDPKPYRDFVLKGDFDVIMNYAAQIWCTDIILPHLKEIKAAKVFVPCGYSKLHEPAFADYYRRMPAYLAQYGADIYLSRTYQDKIFADQHGLKNSLIIPNGADETEFNAPTIGFRKKYGIKTPYMLLCVANHYNLKGHRMLIEAFDKLNRNDVTLVIIGNPVASGRQKWRVECYRHCRLASLKNPRIKVLANVPRDFVVSAYKEATLFVFASMTECSPLVIFESMAAGLPFVSTDVGDVRERSAYGRIVVDLPDMVAQVANLLDNEDTRKKIGAAAVNEWRKNYTWERITDQYEALYQKLVSKRS